MLSREKWIGVTAAVIVGGFILLSIGRYVQSAFQRRDQQIEQIHQDIARREAEIKQGKLASRTIGELEKRALAAGRLIEISHTRYQEWLLAQVQKSGLEQATVRSTGKVPQANGNFVLKYQLSARGTLRQLMSWWYQFYTVGRMHSLRFVTIKPVDGSKLIKIDATVEAYAMPGATDREIEQVDPPAHSVSLDAVERIVSRNPFAPPNHPPTLQAAGKQELAIGSDVEVQLKAQDPDPLDQITYSLVDPPAEAKIDPKSGTFKWKPTTAGTYEIAVIAQDDGTPPLESKSTLTLTVKDAKADAPQERDTSRSTIAFDDAQQAFFCAMTSSNDKSQAWLQVRSTGTTLFLAEGDQLKVGTVSGRVAKIEERDMEIDLGERIVRLHLGDSLGKVVAP